MCAQIQESPLVLVRQYDEVHPYIGANIVQFRLLFSGQLLGANKNDTRASLKHHIRRELHPQLERLWATNKNLHRLTSFMAKYWEEVHSGTMRDDLRPGLPLGEAEDWTEEELRAYGLKYLAEKWSRCDRQFIPLITEEMALRCSLDILFLRPEEPGMLLRGGDLDNRMKTLFDALRLPNNMEEAGGPRSADEIGPTYCLLEDDRLISEIRIVSDQLLMLPKTERLNPNDVFLVIDVKLETTVPTKWKWVFS